MVPPPAASNVSTVLGARARPHRARTCCVVHDGPLRCRPSGGRTADPPRGALLASSAVPVKTPRMFARRPTSSSSRRRATSPSSWMKSASSSDVHIESPHDDRRRALVAGTRLRSFVCVREPRATKPARARAFEVDELDARSRRAGIDAAPTAARRAGWSMVAARARV